MSLTKSVFGTFPCGKTADAYTPVSYTHLLGTQITDAYGVKDVVFEVDNKSLTNRPDLWGHYGIAREFAALTNRELKPVSRMDLTPYASLPGIDIDIRDKELCYRYTCLLYTSYAVPVIK